MKAQQNLNPRNATDLYEVLEGLLAGAEVGAGDDARRPGRPLQHVFGRVAHVLKVKIQS